VYVGALFVGCGVRVIVAVAGSSVRVVVRMGVSFAEGVWSSTVGVCRMDKTSEVAGTVREHEARRTATITVPARHSPLHVDESLLKTDLTNQGLVLAFKSHISMPTCS
jgi:hypothetical protein